MVGRAYCCLCVYNDNSRVKARAYFLPRPFHHSVFGLSIIFSWAAPGPRQPELSSHDDLIICPAFQLHESTSHCYLGKRGGYICEVLSHAGEHVWYRDYFVSSGESLSTESECNVDAFVARAARECTPEERARGKVAAMSQQTRERSSDFRGGSPPRRSAA